ncbi:MAG: ring-opening amidohydrolase [Pseudomonadota bacterium]
MPQARVHVIPTSAPDDVSGLETLIAQGVLDPSRLVAILGKTEGNGCVNDFTRAFSVMALERFLGPHAQGVALVMSGGTEGGLSPHLITFESLDDTGESDAPALAMASHVTRDLDAHEIGTQAQIECVADGVRTAISKAQIRGPDDVAFVQIKCPLLTAERIACALYPTATTDTLKSMGLSRGAAALGVSLALGELDETTANIVQIGVDLNVFSARASTSAGVELMGHEILVLGMSAAWSGPLIIDHAVMSDAIDTAPVASAMSRLGVGTTATLVALLAKAEAAPSGAIRGRRHTMLDDSDISSTRHARGFVGGALAGLTGRTDLFVSGGAEHQGPAGGGPVAVIATKRH